MVTATFLLPLHEFRAGMDVAHFYSYTRRYRVWFLCSQDSFKGDSTMLWTILVILLVLWLIGLLSNVGGSLIHLLLVVAVVVLIINLVTGRRAV